MMKKLSLLLAMMLVFTMMPGCGKKTDPNTLKEDTTLADVMTAVNTKFNEQYGDDYGAVMMPMEIDQQYLTDFCGIEASFVEEYAGAVSMSMTNSDALFAVKAAEGKADAVRAALEKRLEDLVAQYEFYPVSGSLERAQAGEVYQKGDYLFLIVVGRMPEDMDAAVDFAPDVELTKTTIDSMFNG